MGDEREWTMGPLFGCVTHEGRLVPPPVAAVIDPPLLEDTVVVVPKSRLLAAVAACDAAKAKAHGLEVERDLERDGAKTAEAQRDRLAAGLRGIARHAASVGPGFPCSALAEGIEAEALAALSVLDP